MGPDRSLGRAGSAAEGGRGVAAEEQLLGDLPGLPEGGEGPGGVRGAQRGGQVADEAHRTAKAGGGGSGEPADDVEHRGGGGRYGFGGWREGRRAAPPLLRAPRAGAQEVAVLVLVGERQQHLGQRHPVGEGVVEARDDDRSALVAVDEVEVPERAGAVEGLAHPLLDEGLERGLVSRLGQRHVVEVAVEREVLVVLPVRHAQRGRGLDDSLAEDRVAVDEAGLQEGPQALPVHRTVEGHDALDDHEVVRAVHREPDGVDGAHRTASGHVVHLFLPVGPACHPAGRVDTGRGVCSVTPTASPTPRTVRDERKRLARVMSGEPARTFGGTGITVPEWVR